MNMVVKRILIKFFLFGRSCFLNKLIFVIFGFIIKIFVRVLRVGVLLNFFDVLMLMRMLR